MDVFENKVDYEKFKSTNQLWNEIGLSEGWSVGYVSQIIKSKKFHKKEEWYDFYFKSGQERLDLISKLPEQEKQKILNGKRKDYTGLNSNLNLYYGRTKAEIAQKGNILYNAIVKTGNPLDIKIWECQFIAFFRTVCETWNGIMIREINTKEKIENYFQGKGKFISLIDTSGKFDYSYAVDFELYYEGEILCGLQIKPKTYQNKKIGYINDAHNMNISKNEKYKNQYGRDVYYIYSDQNGFIHNHEILTEILSLVK